MSLDLISLIQALRAAYHPNVTNKDCADNTKPVQMLDKVSVNDFSEVANAGEWRSRLMIVHGGDGT